MTTRFHVRLLRYGKLFKLSRALLWWEKLPVKADAPIAQGVSDFGGPTRIRTWNQGIMSPLL